MVEENNATTGVIEAPMRNKRDWLGSIVGLAIVLGGMAILYSVFREALSLFATPPNVAVNVKADQPIDLRSAYNSIFSVILKVILLIIMAWIGSVITNRGIFLYGQSKPGLKS
jgi:ATP/ADP translocase